MNDFEQIKSWNISNRKNIIDFFLLKIQEKNPTIEKEKIIDIGCGVADYSIALCKKFPNIEITGIDASRNMIIQANENIKKSNLSSNISLKNIKIPNNLINKKYDISFSINLLHHLENPLDLWRSMQNFTKENGKIFVMDLIRPNSFDDVELIVNQYAKNEPGLYKKDFENSLKAAYSIDEINKQLHESNLDHLLIEINIGKIKELKMIIIYGTNFNNK